ncbi:PAP2 superfamily protein [Halpernia humi]|uniref:PAP2 superfamily protein n=1 Tax=Halpernia humi TaxID=493375 RepID=A0A1H5UBR3_9FLAO|nr:phosphatase PAP2 family protein [Halpernia humi]SEF71771.1 PAP2 superfamily protein [Halpernia humi]
MPNYSQNSKINFNFKFLFLLILFAFQNSFAQEIKAKDSLGNSLKIKQFIIPAALVGSGFIMLYNPKLNQNIKDDIQKHNSTFHTSIDNYSQFAPGAAVFALNAFGVKGKHNWKDAGLIYAGSIAIASAFVLPLKAITKEERPDFSTNNSFPSGHTAIAFASAEFLRQEYKDTPWIGYVGYAVATGTGILRMYNNRHWFGDVVAGAGFGIASAKLSYFLYDKIFLKNGWNFTLTPIYQNKTLGFAYNYNF